MIRDWYKRLTEEDKNKKREYAKNLFLLSLSEEDKQKIKDYLKQIHYKNM